MGRKHALTLTLTMTVTLTLPPNLTPTLTLMPNMLRRTLRFATRIGGSVPLAWGGWCDYLPSQRWDPPGGVWQVWGCRLCICLCVSTSLFFAILKAFWQPCTGLRALCRYGVQFCFPVRPAGCLPTVVLIHNVGFTMILCHSSPLHQW